jgi:hypothetical protein
MTVCGWFFHAKTLLETEGGPVVLLQATEKHNDSANIFARRDDHRNKKLSEWMERRNAGSLLSK